MPPQPMLSNSIVSTVHHQRPHQGTMVPVPPPMNYMLDYNSGDDPKLQNIVSTANLGCQLNLLHISHHYQNVEYKPKRFAAAIMRIREPKTTALIFASGKMVCTGAKSEEMSETASK